MEKRRIDSSKFNLFLANVIIDFDTFDIHKVCRNEKNIFLYLIFFLRVQHSFTSYNKTNFRNCINNNKYLSSSLIISCVARSSDSGRHNYLHVRGQKNRRAISVPSAILDFLFRFTT